MGLLRSARNDSKYAGVVELADARDSKSRGPKARVGSTPTSGTILPLWNGNSQGLEDRGGGS